MYSFKRIHPVSWWNSNNHTGFSNGYHPAKTLLFVINCSSNTVSELHSDVKIEQWGALMVSALDSWSTRLVSTLDHTNVNNWVHWPASQPSHCTVCLTLICLQYFYYNYDWRKLNVPKPNMKAPKNQQVDIRGNMSPQTRQWCHPQGFRASYE